MAKKRTGKLIQMPSPANYIKTRARNLPIYECMVNEGWDKHQLANVVVARQHTNGNITAGLFLVDLLCLGVKDTIYYFNISETEYRDNIDNFLGSNDDIVKIDYNLAHNIVYAGIEYAENYGFEPHKDFKTTTRYILQEDTDDIPLMEIECGINGLPTLCPEMWDDKKALNRVIAQLECEVGLGQFLLIREDGRIMYDMNDVDDDDIEFNDLDELLDLSWEEKEDLFRSLLPRLNELEDEDLEKFDELIDIICEDLVDETEYEKHYKELSKITSSISVNPDFIPNELLNLKSNQLNEETKKNFIILAEADVDSQEYKRLYKTFKSNPDLDAALGFLDYFNLISKGENDKASKQISNLIQKHPGYPLAKLHHATMIFQDEENESTTSSTVMPTHFFGSRTEVHPLEYSSYLKYLTKQIISEVNINKLYAWKNLVITLPDSMENIALLLETISMIQIVVISGLFLDDQTPL